MWVSLTNLYIEGNLVQPLWKIVQQFHIKLSVFFLVTYCCTPAHLPHRDENLHAHSSLHINVSKSFSDAKNWKMS